MDRSEALRRLGTSKLGHLATVRPDGTPHVVPVTYGVVNNRIVTMVDHKLKKTKRLQRLTNVETNGTAGFLVDYYHDRWEDLWWVRVDGLAEVHRDGACWEEAVGALTEKYHQYRAQPPSGAAISISMDKVSYWSNTP